MQFADIYRGKRVLLTGHTGFKGSWLSLWLQRLGAEVTGIALPPSSTPNHWGLLKLDFESHVQDVRDAAAVEKIIAAAKPDMIFHLAAQPLVRRSYRDPLETLSTNVMGTANVLEPLAGYLTLGQKLLEGKRDCAGAYNFGPDDASNQSVETVLNALSKDWPAVHWQLDGAPQPHEAKLLHLVSGKAKTQLGWQGIWGLDRGLAATAQWYRQYIDAAAVLTLQQLDDYIAAATAAKAGWTQ